MVIANPIYDVVFKFLMEEERVAKFFIGTFLDVEVEEVQFSPEGYTYFSDIYNPDPKKREIAEAKLVERISISVFRLDFTATIKTENGERKKILVEIQKAKNAIDLMRFRTYLGEQYKKEDEMQGEKVILPIVTIYLLGFNLPELNSAVIKVNRQYLDLLTNEIIEKKSDFIEKLTHDSYVVQLGRIGSRVQTKLEKMLSVFEQKYFVNENNTTKEYNYPIEDEDVKRMIDKLHYAGTEPIERKKIEDEKEANRVFQVALQGQHLDLEKTIQEKDKVIEHSGKDLEESKKTIEEKNKTLEENKKELEESKKVMEEKNKLIEELTRRLENK